MIEVSSGQMELYKQEIYRFLHTVTLKFEPFSYMLSQEYMDTYGFGEDQIASEWNFYYRNLCGEYTENDEMMYIYSLEEEKEVPFTREYLDAHPRSAALYRIPNIEYDTLCKKYPNQTGLIKSIVYPAKDVNTVIAAKEFEILHADTSLLYEGERESLVTALVDYLSMVRMRWWVPEYAYENLYSIAFWMLLWQSLPNVLLSQRILNIGTSATHPFHMWEKLTSNGLNDYRDILSPNQTFWLYRNIDWIDKNKGKQDTLEELDKNILEEVKTDTGGVTIKPGTEGTEDDAKPDPDGIVKDIITDEVIDTIPGGTIIDKLVDEDLIPPVDPEEKEEELDDWVKTEEDDIITKLIILVKKPINTRWENLLTEYLFDTLMYRYHSNDLAFTVKFKDEVSNSAFDLAVGDAIALLYYALHKQFAETEVINLPNSVSTRICYHRQRVQTNVLPKTFNLIGHTYYINNYVDTEEMFGRIPYQNKFATFEDFVTWEFEQFKCLLADTRSVIGSGHSLYQEAMGYAYGHLLVHQEHLPITFINSSTKTYADLRKISPHVNTILTAYEGPSVTRDKFVWMAETLMRTLFPLTDARFADLIGINEYLENLYDALKELFIQLCSYNITFLETERQKFDYIESPTHVVHTGGALMEGRPIVYPSTWWVDMYGTQTGMTIRPVISSLSDINGGLFTTIDDIQYNQIPDLNTETMYTSTTISNNTTINIDL